MENLSNYEFWNLVLQIIVVALMLLTAWIYFKNLKKIEEQVEINRNQINAEEKEVKERFLYQKKEKALEMSLFYSEILTDIYDINNIFEDHFKNLNIKTKLSEYKKFTKNEFISIHSEELLNKMINVEEKIIIENYINKTKDYKEKVTLLGFKKNNYNTVEIKNLKNEELLNQISRNNELFLIKSKIKLEFQLKIYEVLNKLEYFSMSFTSKIADEGMVYQSLHQSFVGVISILYPIICHSNSKSTRDKFYTNIILLYNEWLSRLHEKEKLENSIEENLTHKSENQLTI